MACNCNPSYSGGWGRRTTWTWEVEFAVSQDHSTALQLGQQRLCLKKKKKIQVWPGKWSGGTGSDNDEVINSLIQQTFWGTYYLAGTKLSRWWETNTLTLSSWCLQSTGENRYETNNHSWLRNYNWNHGFERKAGQARWLTPVIQELWKPRRADYLRSGVEDQLDQHGETPS